MESFHVARGFWSPPQNLTSWTLVVPQGSTQHDNPHILCPATALYKTIIHITTFFATNYLAHAATVKSTPGDSSLVKALNIFLALLFPASGLIRGLNAIVRRSHAGASELDKACKAGALITVTRDRGWKAPEGQKLGVVVVETTAGRTGQVNFELEERGVIKEADFVPYSPTWARENRSRWLYSDTLWGRSRINLTLSKVHGTYRIPPGYCFTVLPRNTLVLPSIEPGESDRPPMKTEISSSINPAKTLSSIVQLLSALQVLALRRGDTVREWGYASYVLTVVPYSVMSLVNLISNLTSPDYPCLYMVRNEIMTEAEQVEGEFEGVVGRTFPAGARPSPGNGPGELGFGHGPEWTGVTVRGIFRALKMFLGTAPHRPREYNFKAEIAVTPEYVTEPDEPDAGSEVPVMSTEYTQRLILRPDNGLSYQAAIALQQPNLRSTVWRAGHQLLAKYLPLSRAIENSGRGGWWQAIKSFLEALRDTELIFGPVIGWPREKAPKLLHQTRIYYPSCGRFLRQDDEVTFPAGALDAKQSYVFRTHGLSVELAASLASLTGEIASPTWSGERREKGIGPFSLGAYIVSALLFAGILIGATAILSDGFHPGLSSSTQRGVMMAWLATGIFMGILLPLLSLLDWAKILVFLPLAGLLTDSYPRLGYIGMLPIAVFIPPIWGFVLVGLMLKKWGICVVLY